ncbi:type II toxin-antitoxin system CcdA family antitoxin [Caballeronia sp. J97]|uniref:type II toxin-antitoxin system CcdA family antitoxin n=1 Tax=Caballeronia sp. J97 TaxID=2805429 RepID=UPI002AAF12EE|nr:type II toxin-antitoxin system CcdA family antitoxin [Caballeronia sp. J97]
MSTKTTLPCHTAESDEPACHLDEEFGESGAAYLDIDDIGIKLLAPEPCSRAAVDSGLARAVLEIRAEIWRKENGEAIECYNAYVEQDGLPLDGFQTDA